MRSIRDIYKIGTGPSSSHTMGPEAAAKLLKKENPGMKSARVVLYGSLSKTGKGHGTDRAVIAALAPIPAEVLFSKEEPEGMKHPNTLDLFAYDTPVPETGKETAFLRVYSIGGGDIRVEGREEAEKDPAETYLENSFAEIRQFCSMRGIDLAEYISINEDEKIWTYLSEVWSVMKQAIAEGLSKEGILPGGLNIQRKAKILAEEQIDEKKLDIAECKQVCSYAYAVSEQNADNGTIVTAPTCGSCGVLPAVLFYGQKKHGFSDEEVVRALGIAGLFGELAKKNASVSGAECGCQAEIGVACSMAAAAYGQLFGFNTDQIEYSAEIALEHQLGLTCDPICGLVQIPCIERNAVAAMRALTSARLAYFLSGTRRISYDMVLKSMYHTGLDMNKNYRETSEGGLAALYSRRGK